MCPCRRPLGVDRGVGRQGVPGRVGAGRVRESGQGEGTGIADGLVGHRDMHEHTEQRGQRAAGEQAARNAAAGLQHQQRTRQTTGDTPAPVPAGVKAFYKALNPNATDAEISAHYNKTHKAG